MHAGCFAHQGAPYTQGTVHVARQPCLTPHRGVSQEASRAQEPSAEEVQALRAEVELLHQTLQDVTQVPPTLPCTPTAATLSVPQFPLPWWTTAERCPRPSQAVLADDPGSPTEPPRLPCRSLSPAAAAATLGAVHGALRRRHFQLQVSEEEEEEEEDGCGGRRMGGWVRRGWVEENWGWTDGGTWRRMDGWRMDGGQRIGGWMGAGWIGGQVDGCTEDGWRRMDGWTDRWEDG